MSRWIELEPLIEAMGEEPYVWNDEADEIAERNQWLTDIHIIDSAPSIDLVCCKECKKAHLTYDGKCKYCDEWKDTDGNYIEVYHDGNHYCSYGVRKESE